MPDKAHRAIDERLEKLEKQLSAFYLAAGVELQKKADAYFKQFEKQDKAKQKEVDDGKLTEQEYKRWRKKTLMGKTAFTAFKRSTAAMMFAKNEEATKMVIKELSYAYAEGHNQLGISTIDAVNVLPARGGVPFPVYEVDKSRDMAWNEKKIDAIVLGGIAAGLSLMAVGKISSRLISQNLSAMVRNARTTVTAAENKGRIDSYIEAEDEGYKVQKKWVAILDGRTRHAHEELNGKVQDIDKPFVNSSGEIWWPGDPSSAPANRMNCRCHLVPLVDGKETIKINFPRKTKRLTPQRNG